MNPKLQAYLDRIGYEGAVQPDEETLVGLHRAHLLAISYENLDIHRGKSLSLRQDDIYEKIVVNKRGGWCYEMNGLFSWVLREIGFEVRLLASTVNRSATRRSIEGNHLVLYIDMPRPFLANRSYLADVGFGNGFLDPLPLEVGRYDQYGLTYQLWRDGGHWWFQNHRYGGAGYDFNLDSYQLEDFTPQSCELQTSSESPFVQSTVCHRFTPNGVYTLRGAVLRTTTGEGVKERTLETSDAYQEVIETVFDLHLSDLGDLWEKVRARHLVWVSQQGE